MPDYSRMTPADLDAVTQAECAIQDFPWTRGNFADSLAAGHDAWLAREDGQLAGFAVTMPVPDETHLLNIGILPPFRRAGRGSALLMHLLAQARGRNDKRMLLEVRAGNAAGLGFYRHHGFVEIGRRRGYYPARAGREDAIVMAREP